MRAGIGVLVGTKRPAWRRRLTLGLMCKLLLPFPVQYEICRGLASSAFFLTIAGVLAGGTEGHRPARKRLRPCRPNRPPCTHASAGSPFLRPPWSLPCLMPPINDAGEAEGPAAERGADVLAERGRPQRPMSWPAWTSTRRAASGLSRAGSEA